MWKTTSFVQIVYKQKYIITHFSKKNYSIIVLEKYGVGLNNQVRIPTLCVEVPRHFPSIKPAECRRPVHDKYLGVHLPKCMLLIITI